MLQNKEILEQIVLESPHYIFWKDKNLVYAGCSRSFANAIGLDSPNDVIGRTDYDLPWASKYADEFRSEDIQVIQTRKALHNKKVTFFSNKKESLKTFLVSKTPLFFDDSVIGVLCNCYDITKDEERYRRLYKDSLLNMGFSRSTSINNERTFIDNLCHYYESIIACMPGNVYWLDKECVLMGGNDNLAKMFGLQSRSELVGLTYEMMSKLANWTEGQGDSFKTAEIEVMSTGEPKFNIEEPAVIINGEKRYYMGNKVPLRDSSNNVIGMVGISIDVTDRTKIKQDLIQSKEKALIANKSKSEFIANMSHDLRTPITGMLGMMQHMLHSAEQAKSSVYNRDLQQSNKTLQEIISIVERDAKLLMGATDELLQLCNEILEVARIESGASPLHLESFELSALVHHTIELLHPTAQHRKLQLTYEIDPSLPRYLKGARFYLNRILLNLVSNGLKFTEKGAVEIHCTLHGIDSDMIFGQAITLQIQVKDTGIGIPEDKFDQIFEHFSRLTPAYKGIYKGAGLGLYTVKRYVESMQGTIKVDSKLGKGTCFTIRLPFTISDRVDCSQKSIGFTTSVKPDADKAILEDQENVKPDPDKAILKDQENVPIENAIASILLVEDSKLAAIAVTLNLKKLNCHVDTAENGSQAVKMAQEGSYNLIFMDIGLPDFSGVEVTKKIRALNEPIKSQVPIVALTGHANNPEMREEAIDAGMQEVLSKPAQLSQLESILQNYVFKVEAKN